MNEQTSTSSITHAVPPALLESLREAARLASSWEVVPWPRNRSQFSDRSEAMTASLRKLEKDFARFPVDNIPSHQPLRRSAFLEMQKGIRLLRSALADHPHEAETLPRLVSGATPDEPRISGLAHLYLERSSHQFKVKTLLVFLDELQKFETLLYKEIWQLGSHLKFALLETLLRDAQVLMDASDCEDLAQRVMNGLESLRQIALVDWTGILESRIAFDSILLHDPTGTYAEMDFESRELYRRRVAFLARYSDFGELRVAQAALDMAKNAKDDPAQQARTNLRRRHVGYYLIDQGFASLRMRIGFHPPLIWRIRESVRSAADEFYIGGILILTILLTALPLFPLAAYDHVWGELLLALLLLLLPASQASVELVNTVISACFEPSPLPRLDFSTAIPAECSTLVAVPTLLLNVEQVRDLFNSLEVRYLANRDPHLHFALLTDLPDSISKPNDKDAHPLVDLAIQLTEELNRKYAPARRGEFLLLHRHRIFNHRQGAWMGWERKRGKLLDLNKFLIGEFDAFPIKAGNLAMLTSIRYVLTLDSDSQLPRGSASRLIGAMAHPLNQAIIDPASRVVETGYGILQPRVSVTVHSSIRSRMANIFSGQTGLDIYTRAVSDTYQDLFGEGIFTGKGIYELETLHAVLNRRFPRNALLSHDLIEGAYARAGLVTDVELIDDYPSHYSAYSRRKHRWVRGDWQIVQWIFGRVPEESGRMVPNPISFVSRWKILDNLRRSLVDSALFLFLIAAWLVLPVSPLYWTLLIAALLVAPTLLQFVVSLIRIGAATTKTMTIGEAIAALGRNLLITLLNLLLLPHQALLGFDAVLRSLVRGWITGERLLEWETAAQAEETRHRRTPVDRYMAWVPVVALLLAGGLWLDRAHRSALFVAAPFLAGWLLVQVLIAWLNRMPGAQKRTITLAERGLLLGHAQRIWSYFDHFGSAAHNYLIPDNVEEDEFREAARVSPTNIGLLLNARQAACTFGFLTLPEFAERTENSLATIDRLTKFRGHLYNWYDTRTCKPLDAAPFVSTVDSGNFVASLLTLAAGTRSLLESPLLPRQLLQVFPVFRSLAANDPALHRFFAEHPMPTDSAATEAWLNWLHGCAHSGDVQNASVSVLAGDLQARLVALTHLLAEFVPWVSPDHSDVRRLLTWDAQTLSTASLLEFTGSTQVIQAQLQQLCSQSQSEAEREAVESCLHATTQALAAQSRLLEKLRKIATRAEELATATEFAFLVHPDRKVLSIGWDVKEGKVHESCYDMLASEARIATFLAVGRGDLPQQSWFRLARDHAHAFGRFALISWTGTMFEYLMPALWMRTLPNTLLAGTQNASVHIQKAWARKHRIPWGISESGFAERNDSGHYGYFAWGIPDIALAWEAKAGPVVSPYSTFLALSVDPRAVIKNLQLLQAAGWSGRYGLYEAIDYSQSQRNPEPVREWMAHHLGMSLLAIQNHLFDGQVQDWFHANPLVQSVELLLNEMPARKAALKAALELFSRPVPRETVEPQ